MLPCQKTIYGNVSLVFDSIVRRHEGPNHIQLGL